MSLESGSLPADWKKANVIPVFKKCNKHIPSNYRPISLTSLVVKTLEGILHDNILKFLTINCKISSLQHGFKKDHSCQTQLQLLTTVHDWSRSLDRGNSAHTVFLDFAKAFDSVPHQRLILKPESIGIRGKLLQWIRNFLLDRYQRVLIDGQSSDWEPVSSGVPQGSILGHLLFIVYLNDIGEQMNSSIKLFVDDCVIYRQITNMSGREILQNDLNTVYTCYGNLI